MLTSGTQHCKVGRAIQAPINRDIPSACFARGRSSVAGRSTHTAYTGILGMQWSSSHRGISIHRHTRRSRKQHKVQSTHLNMPHHNTVRRSLYTMTPYRYPFSLLLSHPITNPPYPLKLPLPISQSLPVCTNTRQHPKNATQKRYSTTIHIHLPFQTFRLSREDNIFLIHPGILFLLSIHPLHTLS